MIGNLIGKKGAWKPVYKTQDQINEIHRIAAQLKAKRPPGRPKPVKPEGMSDEEFILSLQAQSTRTVLMMTEEEAAKHRDRPMLKLDEVIANKEAFEEYKKNPTDENYRKFIGARNLSPEEILTFKRLQARGHDNTFEQSAESSVTPEMREKAIQAFVYTPPAQVTPEEVEKRAVNLVEYKSEPLKEEWKEMNWFEAFIHWIKGNKVKQDADKGYSNTARMP